MKTTVALAAAVATASLGAHASADRIDFDDLVHGTIVNSQYQASHGLTIAANNPNRNFDIAAAFDSNRSNTRDSDLESPWSGGNLPTNTDLGTLLIIQENKRDRNQDGLLDFPDDEGRRPGGSLTFDFDKAVSSFGFTLVDIEGSPEFPGGFFLAVFNKAQELAQIDFKDLVQRDGSDPIAQAVYDSYAPGTRPIFGDNTINAVQPITAAQVGGAFDRVVIGFGGSGAVGDISFTSVPTPTAVGSGLILMTGLLVRRRRA